MLPNPSHLEAVDPLVYGSVRAIQEFMKDKTRTNNSEKDLVWANLLQRDIKPLFMFKLVFCYLGMVKAKAIKGNINFTAITPSSSYPQLKL